MYTNSWNSGNHFLAFWMMDFRNDTSFWCSASLSDNSLRCLACSSISCRWCSSCCRCICRCNSSMLSSWAATSPCRVRLSAFSSFSLLLKVVFYAYMNNIYSCRKIEDALKYHIHYMWLSGSQTPSFSTINRFRSEHLHRDSLCQAFSAQRVSFTGRSKRRRIILRVRCLV